MALENFKIAKIALPGAFLMLLGLGNIVVGAYKSNQYQAVLTELSQLEEPIPLVNTSLLKRIQLEQNKILRIDQRRSKVRGRIDFYNLVTFGGKVMLSISFLLIGVSLLIKFIRLPS